MSAHHQLQRGCVKCFFTQKLKIKIGSYRFSVPVALPWILLLLKYVSVQATHSFETYIVIVTCEAANQKITACFTNSVG